MQFARKDMRARVPAPTALVSGVGGTPKRDVLQEQHVPQEQHVVTSRHDERHQSFKPAPEAQPVSFDDDPEPENLPLPIPPTAGEQGRQVGPRGDLETIPTPDGLIWPQPDPTRTLRLGDVLRSVVDTYPDIRVAALERNIASGKQVSALGSFDTKAKAFSTAAPEGFYQTYRNGLSLEQPTFSGGYVYGGYKLGRGFIEPWFQERQTNDGGEFSIGFGHPLLRDRRLDQRRADLFRANLQRNAAEPAIQSLILETARVAAFQYWVWVAGGQVVQARRELLQLARQRVEQIDDQIELGDLAEIARINNRQLIAKRETKLIESDRKLQASAIKLSLFLRLPDGQPVLADNSWLPVEFPSEARPDSQQVADDIAAALASRPELVELDFMIEKARVDLAEARNSFLPKVDATILASKDMGMPSSSKNDKGPFILEAGLTGELPIQRRKARGKIIAAQGKLAQLSAKREFIGNKITAEVQDALSAIQAASERIERSRLNLDLAKQTLELGREQFVEGDIDLIGLNIYETSVAEAQILLIEAQADFFIALANYRAALAIPPLNWIAP